MSGKFDFDTCAAYTEDALNLMDTVDELLAPLTQTGQEPDASAIYDLIHRARMIDSALRAARSNVSAALGLFQAADVAVDLHA